MGTKLTNFSVNGGFFVASAVAFLFVILDSRHQARKDIVDLPEIIERGVLYATTNHSPSSYFVYRAEPRGFQLEMLAAFCKHLRILLEIKPENSIDSKLDCLVNQGDCDILALRFNRTHERNEKVDFTRPYAFSRHILVQRMNQEKTNPAARITENEKGPDFSFLDGHTIFVQAGASYKETIDSLSRALGITIRAVELDLNEEELIRMVADGEIDYTVCDEIIARPNRAFFPFLDLENALTGQLGLTWAVRKKTPKLLKAINQWLDEFTKTKEYRSIFSRYFESPPRVFRAGGKFHSLFGSKISPYDDYLKKHAGIIGWDWRLIASLVYQESRFVHDTASWAGARGIMQIMPSTAEGLGLDSLSTIEDNIKAGIRYLKSLDKTLQKFVDDSLERISFVLGAYNSGPGHIIDAIKLAEKYGKDPAKWIGSVDYYIRNKSKYYRDDVVRHGYLRGWETYNHVMEVWRRYVHYRNIVKE